MSTSKHYYSSETLPKLISDFQIRIEEDKSFCEELYETATIRLLAAKYAYYMEQSYLDDQAYDNMEKGWYVMGRALGLLQEDETSPCVGWNENHPLVQKGVELAERLMRSSKKVKKVV